MYTLHFPLNKASTWLTLDNADTVTSVNGLTSIRRSFLSSSSISVSPTNRSWPQFDSSSTRTVIGRRWLLPLPAWVTAPLRLDRMPVSTVRSTAWSTADLEVPPAGDWECAARLRSAFRFGFMPCDFISKSPLLRCFEPDTLSFKLPADRLFLTPMTDESLSMDTMELTDLVILCWSSHHAVLWCIDSVFEDDLLSTFDRTLSNACWLLHTAKTSWNTQSKTHTHIGYITRRRRRYTHRPWGPSLGCSSPLTFELARVRPN